MKKTTSNAPVDTNQVVDCSWRYLKQDKIYFIEIPVVPLQTPGEEVPKTMFRKNAFLLFFSFI
jgi:hypothetical protein